MKRIRFSILFLLVILSAGLEINAQEIKSDIPYFTFYTLDKKPFTKDSLDTSRPKLFFYFNSECEHCQKQGKWFKKALEKTPNVFNGVELVFISFEELSSIQSFQKKYTFNRKDITYLQDSRLTFGHKFNVETFPSIVIYDNNGIFIKKFEGETKIEELLPYTKLSH